MQLAFREFDFSKNIFGGAWVGLQLLRQFFNHPIFWRLIRNTFNISFASLIIGFPAPILLALFINQIKRKAEESFSDNSLHASLHIYDGDGGAVGRPSLAEQRSDWKDFDFAPRHWEPAGEASAFCPCVRVVGRLAACGLGAIIYLAALSSVDMECTMRARVDGGSRWDIIRHVEFPPLCLRW